MVTEIASVSIPSEPLHPLADTVPNKATSKDKASVVIVVPRYQASLQKDDLLALKHLQHYLGGYDTVYVCPRSLHIENPEFPIKYFDNEYFSGIPGYNRLMLSSTFYETFQAWEYILIYQLDCLVFSDQLSEWCSKGYDYIGPPWLNDMDEPEKGFSRVGNGGFSLRKVSTFLKVLEDADNLLLAMKNIYRLTRNGDTWLRRIPLWWVLLLWYRHPARFRHYEDRFWSAYADKYYAQYKVPTVDVALPFGFECAPAYCFRMNYCQLPFGAHAWAKYNRAFWEPYLLSD